MELESPPPADAFLGRTAVFFKRVSSGRAKLKDGLNGTTVWLSQLGLGDPLTWSELRAGDDIAYDLRVSPDRYEAAAGTAYRISESPPGA